MLAILQLHSMCDSLGCTGPLAVSLASPTIFYMSTAPSILAPFTPTKVICWRWFLFAPARPPPSRWGGGPEVEQDARHSEVCIICGEALRLNASQAFWGTSLVEYSEEGLAEPDRPGK